MTTALIHSSGHSHTHGLVEIWFKGTLLTLNRQDLDALLNGQPISWAIFYQIGLFDVRDSCIRTGFQSRTSSITLREFEELNLTLQEAYLQAT